MSDDEKEVTSEEAEALRKKTLEFYDKQNKVLEKQLKYETLQAEIQEQKTKAFFFWGQRSAPKPSDEEENKPSGFKESEDRNKSRKLATE